MLREKYQLVASNTCPDWELNPQPSYTPWRRIKLSPSGAWDNAPTAKPPSQGWKLSFCLFWKHLNATRMISSLNIWWNFLEKPAGSNIFAGWLCHQISLFLLVGLWQFVHLGFSTSSSVIYRKYYFLENYLFLSGFKKLKQIVS